MTAKKGKGLTKKYTPSDELAEVIGSAAVTRGDALKKVWVYIKENDLQDENDGRYFECDSTLKAIFGKKRCFMTDVAKGLSNHLEG